MIFTETKLPSAFVIDLERRSDERGFFARAWCQDEFSAHGLNLPFVQANVASSKTKGTLRGLHYQRPPHAEAKLVRCTRGSIYDVIVDVRPESPTYKQWLGVELSEDKYRMLYVPEGFAHGYQTLTDDAEVHYMVTAAYTPGAEQGIRYDDKALGIQWPVDVQVISEKDLNWAPFRDEHA